MGYWKFNNFLLADSNYTYLIENVVKAELSSYSSFLNPSSGWERINFVVRSETIKYYELKVSKVCKNQKELLTTISSLKDSFVVTARSCHSKYQLPGNSYTREAREKLSGARVKLQSMNFTVLLSV